MVHNFQRIQSSNDTASVHYIVHAHVPRGLRGSLKVWGLDANGRRSYVRFFDFFHLEALACLDDCKNGIRYHFVLRQSQGEMNDTFPTLFCVNPCR